MKQYKLLVIALCMALFSLVPVTPDAKAFFSKGNDLKLSAYPLPEKKPGHCCDIMEVKQNETYINSKQAMVAALGLYLGLSEAKSPEMKDPLL